MTGFYVAACVVALLGALFDSKGGRIPDWLTLPAIAGGVLAHFVFAKTQGLPNEGAAIEAGLSLAGIAVCSFVPLILFRQSAIGGGDVKLFAALGSILQVRVGIEAETYAFFAAAFLAPARLAFEGKLWSTIKSAGLLSVNVFMPKGKQYAVSTEAMSWFKLGPSIFVGTLVAAYLNWREPG